MASDQGGSQGANNSSDFVRKLYKMLEDPSYDSVVRWGNEGDSFVVLENEKFTKSILPKHFKHSNFASFVRQLNKYDFHKVRHNNEESGQSQYGANAWEFKHPDFRMNNKDALDNIRRKAPVPRKSNAATEEVLPTQQIDLVNTQLAATQQQLATISERFDNLGMHHQMLLQEVIGLQKTVVNHEHVIQQVMSFLHSVDSQRRRDSRIGSVNPFAQPGPPAQNGTMEQNQGASADEDDGPASPLQNADKLLHDLNANAVLSSRNLEEMNSHVRRIAQVTTPPPAEATFRSQHRQSSREPPQSASSTSSNRYGDIDHMVYPVGDSNGIDPSYGPHAHNIPYPMPTGPVEQAEPRPQPPPQQQNQQQPQGKKKYDPGWIRRPQVLLVEDDPTCRRIGGKFLYAFDCDVDQALDGLEAVNKMNAGSKYDLVLMDIIMPNLDGVSACHLIRQFDETPIIAMTSNIRSDDINMYFQHGMNDVLPKPFTKEGLILCLDKHLGHIKKSAAGMQDSSRVSMRGDESPTQSPATLSTNWNPPAHMHGPPSATSNMSHEEYVHAMQRQQYGTLDGSGAPYNQNHSAPHTPLSAGPPGRHQQGPHRRQVSEMSGGEDPNSQSKRHQMYPPMQGHMYPHRQ